MRSEKGESVIVMKTFCALLVTSILSLSAAIAATEQEIVNQSAAILRDFRRMPERGIPAAVLREESAALLQTFFKARRRGDVADV